MTQFDQLVTEHKNSANEQNKQCQIQRDINVEIKEINDEEDDHESDEDMEDTQTDSPVK